jgi:CheY-like chemotaxis protein
LEEPPLNTVLLVDDDPQIGGVVSECLAPIGVEVVQVGTLLEAVLAANRTLPAVVLLDLHLADADGLSFIAALRAEPALRSVPILAFSAHAERHQEALGRGVDGFISKPCGCEALRIAITPHLKPPPRGRGGAAA